MKITLLLVLLASTVGLSAIAAEDPKPPSGGWTESDFSVGHVCGSPDVMDRSMLKDSKFLLRAEQFRMRDLPNFELKDWPQRPEVDATLVNQIDQVKTEVPEWHGLHHMVPGKGAPKN